MLKFFRTIRKKLIEQDNVRKYLLYAIGEILLVVIGILVALQVNNWNEDRKLLNEEQLVLQSLQAEISESIDQLEERYRVESTTAERIKIILREGPALDSLLSHPKVDSLMWGPLWSTVVEVPVLQTYSDLKSSGNISIIQNHLIREGLAELQFGLDNLDRVQKGLLTIQEQRMDEIAIGEIDFVTLLQKTRFDDLSPGAENDYQTLFKNRRVRNTLGAKLTMMSAALDDRNEIIASCKNLLRHIEMDMEG